MQIAIIADTHLPRGARRLPPACLQRLAGADLIVHAGDIRTAAVLRELESLNPVVAVRGNVDDAELQALLPETAVLPLAGGPQVVVVHDAGPARGRSERLRRRFPQAGAVIFGHSHIPLHELDGDGFQIFNPGSPTERRRSPQHTMGLAQISGNQIAFSLVELG